MKQLLLSLLMFFQCSRALEHSLFGDTTLTPEDGELFRLYNDERMSQDTSSQGNSYQDSEYSQDESSYEYSYNEDQSPTPSLEPTDYNWHIIVQTWDEDQWKAYGADNLSQAAFRALRVCEPHEVKIITDELLAVLRIISPDTSDDESESSSSGTICDEQEHDSAYQLAKSRGARKHTGYDLREKNNHAKKKALTPKEKRKNRRKKVDKGAYTHLKANQLKDTKQQMLKSCEYDSFKDETTPDNAHTIATDRDDVSATSDNDAIPQEASHEPEQPYFFELLSQLKRGIISPDDLLFEINGYDSDDSSESCSFDDDLEEWTTIIHEWDNDRRRAYGEDYLAACALKSIKQNPAQGMSTLMGFYVMLDNMAYQERESRQISASDDDMQSITRDEFFKTYQQSIAAFKSFAARLDMYDLFEDFERHRGYLGLKTEYPWDNRDEYVRIDFSDSFERLPHYLSQATSTLVHNAIDAARDTMEQADASFEHYLATIAKKIAQFVQEEKDDAAAHDAYYTNIAAQDDDNDDEYTLSKSRGTRRRTANMQHKRNENAAKKSLVHKQRKAHRAAYAQLKADQLRDTKQQELQSREYVSLKNEMARNAHPELRTHDAKHASAQEESPYFFELLSQLHRGMISPAQLLLGAQENDDDSPSSKSGTLTAQQKRDVQEEAIKRKKVARQARKKQIADAEKEALDTMLRDVRESARPITLKTLFDYFSLYRDFLKLPIDGSELNTPGIQASFKKLVRARAQANNQMLNIAMECAYPLMYESKATFGEYLERMATKLGNCIQQAQEDTDQNNSDQDNHDDAYQLAKSRGARRRAANKQHTSDENAEKKSLVHKERKVQKAECAQLKESQTADTKKQALKPSDEVIQLAHDLDALSLHPQDDDSDSSPADDQEANSEWEVCSDYKVCPNPDCNLNLPRVFCRCEYGVKLAASQGTDDSSSTPETTVYHSDADSASNDDNSSDMSLGTNSDSESTQQAPDAQKAAYPRDDDNDYDDKPSGNGDENRGYDDVDQVDCIF